MYTKLMESKVDFLCVADLVFIPPHFPCVWWEDGLELVQCDLNRYNLCESGRRCQLFSSNAPMRSTARPGGTLPGGRWARARRSTRSSRFTSRGPKGAGCGM